MKPTRFHNETGKSGTHNLFALPALPVQRPPSGFTLIELLAVTTIIGIIAAMVIGIAGYSQRRSAVARTQAEMAEMMRALEAYKLDYGTYPAGSSGAVNSSTNIHKAVTSGRGYMTFTKNQLSISGTTTNILDPFGNPYYYRSDGNAAQRNKVTYDLWSTGPSPSVTNQWITNWQ